MRPASDLLEIPEVRARLSPISLEQYHRLPEFNQNGRRTELVRGIVLEKEPKSPLHCSVARRLDERLQAHLPEDTVLLRCDPLTLTDSEPEPDFALVQGKPSDLRQHHPTTALLVVEIAVSSAALDREKAAHYAEAGVQEYWIILASERRVEVYRQPENGGYHECSSLEGMARLQALSLPELSISLAEIFS